MIDLTPIEIRKKKGDFPRSLRGYDVAEVDLFLELAADRLEEVVTAVRALEARANQLEEKLEQYRTREQALTDALVSAQALGEEVRQQAEREGELIRRTAKADAEELRRSALLAVEQERDALRRLGARRVQALHSYRQLLERELAELAVMAETAVQEPEEISDATSVLLDEVVSDHLP
jgi:cell division initiation protein